MRYKLSILLLFVTVNVFAQKHSFEEKNKLAFNQKYKQLKEANCYIPPSNSYCKIRKQKTLIDSLAFFTIDNQFFSKLVDEIIIVNEDHLFPQNRIFIHRLINHFVRDTNVYFFFETLKPYKDITESHLDTLNVGKHLGFYIAEPQMAENIRLITKKHKRPLFSYESHLKYFDIKKYKALGLDTKVSFYFFKCFMKAASKNNGIYSSMNIRDMNQFMNFYQKYQAIKLKNKNARFVVFCGHGHISEKRKKSSIKDISWFNFAFLLKRYLKIDPLTIELTNLTDKCSYNQNKYYPFISNKYGDSHFLYTVADSVIKYKLYMPLYEGSDTDYLIFSPVITYDDNRENWLKYDGKQKVLFDKRYATKTHSAVFKAYYKNENPKKSTPADILYFDKQKTNCFFLYKGDYMIFSDDKLIYSITVN